MAEDTTETLRHFEPEIPPEHLKIYDAVRAGDLTLAGLSRILDQDGLVEECSNINGFERRLKYYLENGIQGTLVAVDVDNFKLFNDSEGHPAGDNLLRLAGRILYRQTRSHPQKESEQENEKRQTRKQELDLLARGGDEFLIFLVGAEINDAVSAARRIRHNIATEVRKLFPNYGPEQTISLGLTGTRDNDDVKVLRQRVDIALYKAKQGKGTANIENAIVVN